MEHEKPMIVCCLYAASDLGHFPRKARSKVFCVGEKRPMEFNESAFPTKRRMLMFNETNSANGSKKNGEQYEKTAEKSGGYCTEQAWKIRLENDISISKKGKGKMVQEMVPQTPSPSKWMSKNDVLNHLEKKIEPTCYTTRRRRLELNETSMANVGDIRVSFKGPKKKEKNIKKVGLNVERKAMKAWCKLLRAVPPDNVDGVWPEVLFIVKVGKIQGPRLYQPWKGSVLDSVLGALLTQRVHDDSSSSALCPLV